MINKSQKIPIRSKMSDDELAMLLKKAQETNPEQFSNRTSGESTVTNSKCGYKSMVSDVVSKWL